jgi:predicted small secreted protein
MEKKEKRVTYNGEIGREALQQITISEDLNEKFDFSIDAKTGNLCIKEKSSNEREEAVKEKGK